MTLSEIYRMLCALYGVTEAPDLDRFLVALPPRMADAIVGHRVPSREALFVRGTTEDVELALFVDPEILAQLRSDPLGHLDALACAAEGASHFLCVADHACRGRAVSRLELELQGEVDKFLIIHLLAAAAGRDADPRLFAQQFEAHRFDERLDDDERDRYATASHLAAKYCAFLRERFFNPLRRQELTAEARGFFRRTLAEKVERLIP